MGLNFKSMVHNIFGLFVEVNMNRKQFIESHGATCKNWYFSWSFINESEKFIIFGAWDRFTNGKIAMILSEDWRELRGKKSKGYDQSREHIRLIEEEGYRLKTFPMKYVEATDDADGPAKIGGFTRELTEKKVTKIGGSWYAVDPNNIGPLAEELPTPEKFVEGARCIVTINAYERNPKARAACIAHHGVKCAVCGFDFGDAYGTLGAGFIHVHHIVPIGKTGTEYEIDPIVDLIPICPNCHAMIHRAEPPLTVEHLRDHIRQVPIPPPAPISCGRDLP
jgi:5-methylcytosine-specific restriction enzyme A